MCCWHHGRKGTRHGPAGREPKKKVVVSATLAEARPGPSCMGDCAPENELGSAWTPLLRPLRPSA